MNFLPSNNIVTIRNPATAHLQIASIDRLAAGTAAVASLTYSTDFQISKNNSLLNGYFTRIAVQEVTVNYGVNNIDSAWGNNYLSVKMPSGTSTVTTAFIPSGNYSVAQALNTVSANLNSAFHTNGINVSSFVSTSSGFTLSGIGNGPTGAVNTQGIASLYFVLATAPTFTAPVIVQLSALAEQLNLDTNVPFTSSYAEYPIQFPLLLPFTYFDIVSPQLTVNQSVKDTTTSLYDQNILYRWHIAWSAPAQQDGLGYPIQQGYIPFTERRFIPFPKQIAFSPNIPIGQLQFQVLYQPGPGAPPKPIPVAPVFLSTINGIPIPVQGIGNEFEWNMTCLVSEN
jgi:hypothetical protein